MFGSTSAFGQSSNSPFGSPSVFGQSNTTNNNPFGGGSSMFGGTSTGVFGGAATQSPSPSAFGASTTPAFGATSSAFGGLSVFGQQQQKPAFGGFGSNTSQASPFGGNTFQQQQPAFGTNLFNASSQPAFGASTTTPVFGSATTNTPAFGSTTTTPAFGSTGSAFGTGGTFSVSNNTSAFGTPAFGGQSSSTSAPSSFSFASSPAFGQSTSAFGTTAFGPSPSPSPFGAQPSPFGNPQATTTPSFGNTGFGQSTFGAQRGGSRVAAYTPTAEVDSTTNQPTTGKLESISAMPVYKDKSPEELRWEDYQSDDKGGPSSGAAQPTTGGTIGFGGATNTTQPNPFAPSPGFGQLSANTFSSPTPSTNPFVPKPATPAFSTPGFGNTATSTFGTSPFGGSTTANPFGSTPAATSSIFGQNPAPAFGTNNPPSIFGTSSSNAFGPSSSIFSSSPASSGMTQALSSGFNFGNTQSAPPFQSTTPSLGQTSSIFGQNSAPSFGQTTPSFGQTTPSFGQTTPFTGFGGNVFSSTPSSISTSNPIGFGQTTLSLSTPFQPAQPTQTPGPFGFGNLGQTQSAVVTTNFGGMPSNFGQNTFAQSPSTTLSLSPPVAVTSPFGTLPAMPQMSIGRSGTLPSVQYGISNLPVVNKPTPVRVSSLLASRHLSQSRIRLPSRNYHRNGGPKVPSFTDEEETPSIPKADAHFIPRENPRALVIRPLEQWPPRTNSDTLSPQKDRSTPCRENEEPVENGKQPDTIDLDLKLNNVENDSTNKREAGIESLLPKISHPDYYTEPCIQELAAKEMAEPGFCRHVKNFVVGRRGFGKIKFIGDTDVTGLDIGSLVQFNNREVIVYMDESKKPPVGQGLNKPAEVTLLNIKCFDKKTGRQYTEGPKIDRYMDMLRRKTEDQGAKFVLYDPVKGVWKFRVNHFSSYGFGTEDEDH